MILDELVLHDFGVYGGRQSLNLSPAALDRPIVLVGGLNGGGKTTILEAIQLCLYGPAAACVERGGYETLLRNRIHRGGGAREAGLELAFRHRSNGVEHSWRIVRSWSIGPKSTCRETVEVLRDGSLDRLATSNWAEQVEEFLPARIASLFLFDGERIETYADPDEAPALISTAIHNLLGLDVVERLGADLITLERRKRSERSPIASSPVDEVRERLQHLEANRVAVQRHAAECNDAHDRAARDLRTAEERFRREGGGLYERRAELESDVAAASRRLDAIERDLHEQASGVTPLLMVTDLISAMRDRDEVERDAAQAAGLASALREEHVALLRLPELQSIGAGPLAAIERALRERQAKHECSATMPIQLALDREAAGILSGLVAGGLDETREIVRARCADAARARGALYDAERALAAAPSGGELEQLALSRDELRLVVARLMSDLRSANESMAELDREIVQLREREARLAEIEAVERFRAEDDERVLAHSARVRGTLLRFREAVVARHVARIETLVLESFQRLVRKTGLVTALRIDPTTFALELTSGDGHVLMPSQLSAGERQLLAVSILWGLAKASGRPLPTVIDTPLGRLDSNHRERLVERYFPHASHQVVLLSTDEEIAGGYHKALIPWIGRSYRLDFDEALGHTVIAEGYLKAGGVLDVA